MPEPPETARTLQVGAHRIGVAEYGAPGGRPVLFFHGTPGSRLQAAVGSQLATEAGARLIALERPGYGLSSPPLLRSISEWPDVVASALDQMGVDRCAVLGVSGGAPFALACAATLPSRISGVAAVSPFFWPAAEDRRQMRGGNRLAFALAAKAPSLVRISMGAMARATQRPERTEKLMRREMANRTGWGEDHLRVQVTDTVESFRQGAAAAAAELALLVHPWPFAPSDVAVPVAIWHGRQDRNIPMASSRRAAAHLPTAELQEVDGGHYPAPEVLAAALAWLMAR